MCVGNFSSVEPSCSSHPGACFELASTSQLRKILRMSTRDISRVFLRESRRANCHTNLDDESREENPVQRHAHLWHNTSNCVVTLLISITILKVMNCNKERSLQAIVIRDERHTRNDLST